MEINKLRKRHPLWDGYYGVGHGDGHGVRHVGAHEDTHGAGVYGHLQFINRSFFINII